MEVIIKILMWSNRLIMKQTDINRLNHDTIILNFSFKRHRQGALGGDNRLLPAGQRHAKITTMPGLVDDTALPLRMHDRHNIFLQPHRTDQHLVEAPLYMHRIGQFQRAKKRPVDIIQKDINAPFCLQHFRHGRMSRTIIL